jgi:hypothetical protein
MPTVISALILALCLPAAAAASPDWQALGSEAVALLAQYLAIDTTNPPGNETKAAEFLRTVFDRPGIEAASSSPSPGAAASMPGCEATGCDGPPSC